LNADFRAIDLDNQSRKGRMPGKKPLNCRNRTVAREERKWQIESKFNCKRSSAALLIGS
jgi:hypothetical protein